MKIEDTLENKAKFFAQYWGQNILSDGIEVGGNVGDCEVDMFLELKPLSSITDEEAIEISKSHMDINKVTGKFTFSGRDASIRFVKNNIYFLVDYTRTADYLRSKGYATPCMGLPVKDQIQYGWVKLQTT